jgi:hypothetical protein
MKAKIKNGGGGGGGQELQEVRPEGADQQNRGVGEVFSHCER